jgi:HK97 gp10 family phage protein
MADFGSLSAFAAHLTALTVHIEHARHESLEEAAKIVETEAKRVIGTYDYGWAPLAVSTLARKAADTPLLETGEMRKSIGHRVGRDEAQVGSNSDKAVWHELGTSKAPPRPFLMGAATHKEEEVRSILGRRTVAAILKR